MRALRLWTLRLALLGASCLLALLAAEAGLRLAGIGSDQLLQPDPVLGVKHIPGKRGLNQEKCFRARVSINSRGWRSPEVPYAKAPGALRVVVLGDSFMDALQVDDDQTFSSRLAVLLAGDTGRTVEVVNLGCASYGTDQELLALREEGLRYHPDLVVLAFYAQNDVRNNVRALEREISTYPKPFFRLDQGRLVEEPFRDRASPLARWAQRAVARFRLYPLLKNLIFEVPFLHRALYRAGLIGVVPRAGEAGEGGEAAERILPGRWRHQVDVFESPLDPRFQAAWNLAEALIVGTRDLARDAGAAFLLVEVAEPVAVLPPEWLREEELGVDPARLDLDAPRRRLAEIAARRQIDFVPLTPLFRDRIAGSAREWAALFLPCNGHWTPAGHQLAAESVAAHLARDRGFGG